MGSHVAEDGFVLEVVQGSAGPEVLKVARSPAARERLRAEAEVLAAIDHPGVVRIGHVVEDAGATTLTLQWAGSATAATVGPLSDEAVVRLGALLADALDALHGAGHAHGRISAEHVLMGGGRPVLCGLGQASEATEQSTRADVAGLASVLQDLRRPTTRPSARGRVLDDLLRRSVRAGADAPGAARLARALTALDRSPAPRPATPKPVMVRRPRILLAVLVSTVALLGAVGAGARVMRGPAPETAGTDRSGARSAPDPATSPASCPEPHEPPAPRADTDGDGCPGRISPTSGGLLVEGRRYRLGRRGDRVAVGDWDCDGTATPVLLRPGSSAVLVYDGWPDAEEPAVEARSIPAPGASDLRVGAGRCPRLFAVDHDGRQHLILGDEP